MSLPSLYSGMTRETLLSVVQPTCLYISSFHTLFHFYFWTTLIFAGDPTTTNVRHGCLQIIDDTTPDRFASNWTRKPITYLNVNNASRYGRQIAKLYDRLWMFYNVHRDARNSPSCGGWAPVQKWKGQDDRSWMAVNKGMMGTRDVGCGNGVPPRAPPDRRDGIDTRGVAEFTRPLLLNWCLLF